MCVLIIAVHLYSMESNTLTGEKVNIDTYSSMVDTTTLKPSVTNGSSSTVHCISINEGSGNGLVGMTVQISVCCVASYVLSMELFSSTVTTGDGTT